MERILLTRNQLSSIEGNLLIESRNRNLDPKETLKSYREKSKVDSKEIEECFYGPDYHLRKDIFKAFENEKLLKYVMA